MLILCQSDILPQTYHHFLHKRRNFLHIYFLCICYWLSEYSVHEKSFAFTRMWQTAIPHLGAQPIKEIVYCYPQTDFMVSQFFSVARPIDPSSWDQNSAEFMLVRYLTPNLSSFSTKAKEIFMYIFFYI